ncbi:MAG TPA: M1 family metallopeptidase, partial [Longimicrobiaceae bacterium]|nr:M1 family metallopeptidase [Longimicrobiaceae bacterium]
AAPLAAQHAPMANGDTSVFRRLDLPTPNQYRSANGEPGPAYWQQRADYRISTRLDPATRSVSGTETIRYENNSPDALSYVWLQVDQNIYRPGSLGSFANPATSRWGARDFQGGLNLEYARVGDQAVTPYIYDTMMRVDLPRPLEPGESVELSFGWSFLVPEHGSDRMGREGNLYEIAQWFPRMAVFDDVHGWNTDPYLGQGEFYREFGDYDVRITVPANYVVAATGTLQNPGEVLTPAQRQRLERAEDDTAQVAIITAQEAGTAAARPPRADGTLTWHYTAENVHDFAWAASPDFQWDATSWNGVTCNALYEPSASQAWRTGADMTCFSIREFSTRWFPYPWPQATSVAGPVGGMEYPMFVMVHSSGSEESVFGTIAHEHGHEWFPMIVSSNERRYAWMDEGFNTFIDTWADDTRYPGSQTKMYHRRAYLNTVAQGNEQPIITPPDRLAREVLGTEGYRKPSTVLHMLRDQVVGPEAFDKAFRTYIRRWAYKHPTPADFFRTFEDVTGRDLDWYWREWIYSTNVLDLAIRGVSNDSVGPGQYQASIRVTRNTPVVMPVGMRLILANGQAKTVELPVQIWYGGREYTYVADVTSPVVGVQLDPANNLADVNRTNDAWGTAR